MITLPLAIAGALTAAWSPTPPPTNTTGGAGDPSFSAFARALETTLNEGFDQSFVGTVDFEALLDRAIGDLAPDARTLEEMSAGLKNEFHRRGKVLPVAEGAKLTFLHVLERSGGPAAIYRVTTDGGRLDYAELDLERDSMGTCKVVDFYSHLSDFRSSTKLRVMLGGLLEEKPGAEARDESASDLLAAGTRIRTSLQAGQIDEGRAALDAALERWPNSRELAMLKVDLAKSSPGTESQRYMDSMRSLRDAFPNDPSVDLVLLELLFEEKQREATVAALDRIGERIGGDPYLDYLRGVAHALAEEYEPAMQAMERALAADPTIFPARRDLARLQLRLEEHAALVGTLDVLAADFLYALEHFAQREGYDSFLESPERARWVEARRVGERELQDLAQRLQQAVDEGDPQPLNDAFDTRRFLTRSLVRVNASRSVIKHYLKRYEDLGGSGAWLIEASLEDGSLGFLGVVEREGSQWMRFRALTADYSLNYIDLATERGAGGAPVVVDIYDLLQASAASEGFRQAATLLVGKADGEYLAGIKQLSSARDAFYAGDYEAAWKLFEDLPTELRSEHSRLLGLHAAAEVSGEDYEEMLSAFRVAFPSSPSLDLRLVNYLIEGDLEGLLGAIDRVEAYVGPDAYLDCLRGETYAEHGRERDAADAIRIAIRRAPDWDEAYFSLLYVGSLVERWDLCIRAIEKLEDDFGWDLSDLVGTDHYAALVASDMYANWSRKRSAGGDDR